MEVQFQRHERIGVVQPIATRAIKEATLYIYQMRPWLFWLVTPAIVINNLRSWYGHCQLMAKLARVDETGRPIAPLPRFTGSVWNVCRGRRVQLPQSSPSLTKPG